MREASEAAVLGDFDDASFDHFGETSTFLRRDDGFAVRTDGPGGEPAEFPVAYTFGVEPLQQYLLPLEDGRLQALGVAWDARPRAEGGQRWFHLYPDEAIPAGDVLHWTQPPQNWNRQCAACHSTNLRKGYDLESDRYETTWSDLEVACEACHGPGSAHVAWAERGGEPPPHAGFVFDLAVGNDAEWRFEPGEPIARRSAPLATRAELETCAPCHARRSPLREGPEFGRPLLDAYRPALLDEGLYHADGQILEEVYVYGSFLQSRMYAAGVRCSDCHEPHALAIEGDADAACARCHQPEHFAAREHHLHEPGSAGASCVACHMPARVYMGVDARRDHSFRVPRPDLTETLGTPNACNDCHAERPARWAADVLTEAHGAPSPHFAEVIEAGRRGAPRAARRLARLADDRAQPGIVRATALSLLGTLPDPAVVATLDSALRDPDALVRMAAAEASEWLEPASRVRLVRPLLRDPVLAVRLQAARTLSAVPREALAPGDAAPLAAALAEWREAQAVNADGPGAHVNLGVYYTERGDLARARSEYETALRLAPWFIPATVNLADLERMAGREAEGEALLRRGLVRAPDDPSLHHSLGLLLAREKRRDEALEHLERAAQLAPERSRYTYVLAIGLNDAGRAPEAIAALEAARERHPGDRALLFGLATFERDRGDLAAARRWARELEALTPEDPAVQGLLQDLGAPSAN